MEGRSLDSLGGPCVSSYILGFEGSVSSKPCRPGVVPMFGMREGRGRGGRERERGRKSERERERESERDRVRERELERVRESYREL